MVAATETKDWSKLKALAPPAPSKWDALRSIAPPPPEDHPWWQEAAHGAVKAFGKGAQLLRRAEAAYSDAVGGVLEHVIPGMGAAARDVPQVHPEETAQAVAPISPEEQGSFPERAGEVVGGLAQLPLLGSTLPVTAPVVFGGEAAVDTYDTVKGQGGSEHDAWKAAIAQGGVSAATTVLGAKLASALNVNTGGWFSKLLKGGAAGIGTGQAATIASNLVTKYTAEEDRKAWTGLSGQAATDALAGVLTSVFFPGHAIPDEQRGAMEAVEKAAPVAVEPSAPETAPSLPTPGRRSPSAPLGPTPVEHPLKSAPIHEVEGLLRQNLEFETSRAAEVLGRRGYSQDRIENFIELQHEARTGGGDAAQLAGTVVDKITSSLPEADRAYLQEPPPTGYPTAELGQALALKRAALRGAPIGKKPPGMDARTWAAEQPKREAEYQAKVSEGWKSLEWGRLSYDWREHLSMLPEEASQIIPEHPAHAEHEEMGRIYNTMRKLEENDRDLRQRGLGFEADKLTVKRIELLRKFNALGLEAQVKLAESRSSAPAARQENWAEKIDPKDVASDPIDVDRAAELALNGTPPGPPKPPWEPTAIPDPKSSSFAEIARAWKGDRWEGDTWARVEAAKKYQQIKDILGLKFFSKAGQKALTMPKGAQPQDQVLYGMQLGIDAYGKLDDAFARLGGNIPQDAMDALKSVAAVSPEQNAQIRGMIEQIRQENGPEGFGGIVKDAGLIQEAKENYTRRIYEKQEQPDAPVPKARFSTFSTAQLPRQYETILDALAAGRTLKVKSAIDAQMISRQELTRAIADKNFIEAGKKAGVFAHDTVGEHEGWKQIEHPGFKGWTPMAKIQMPTSAQEFAKILGENIGEPIPIEEGIKVYGWSMQGRESHVLGRDMMFVPDNERGTLTIMQKRPIFAAPENADEINRFLSSSAPNAFDRFQNASKRLLLKVPLIHTARVLRQQFFTGAWDSPQDANPMAVYRNGHDMVMDFDPKLRFLVRNGLSLGVAPEVSESINQQRTIIGRYIDNVAQRNRFTAAASEWLRNVSDQHADFLFQKYLPALQAQTGIREYDNLTMRGYEDVDAAQGAARASNTSLGNLNLQDLGRRAQTQRWLNRLFFAPMWLESNMRKATEAFDAGAVGHANRMMWQRLLMRYGAIYAAGNMAAALIEDPDKPGQQLYKNMQAQWGGGMRQMLGIDITPELALMGRKNPRRFYLGILGGYADTAQMAAAAGNALTLGQTPPGPLHASATDLFEDKLNVVGRAALMALSGKDKLNEQVTNLDELRGVDDLGNYKTNRAGKYAAGMPKGGKLAGQFVSYQSHAKPGPVAPEQYPSVIGYQIEHGIPIHVQSATDMLRGQMDGWEFLLRNLFDVSMGPREKK